MAQTAERSGLVGVLLRDQQYLKEEMQRCPETCRELLARELSAVEDRLNRLRMQQSSTR